MKIVTEHEFLLIKKAKRNAELIKKIKKLNKDITELIKNIVSETLNQ